MLTVGEVEALLQEHSDAGGEFDWNGWSESAWRGKFVTEVAGLGEVTAWEHDFNGIETNVSYLLFQIGDRVFRKEGLWVSHDGQYWDGYFTEVKPVQKVITDYEVI